MKYLNSQSHHKYNPGDRVNHPSYGDGTVMSCEGEQVVIRFDSEDGERVLPTDCSALVRLLRHSSPSAVDVGKGVVSQHLPTKNENEPQKKIENAEKIAVRVLTVALIFIVLALFFGCAASAGSYSTSRSSSSSSTSSTAANSNYKQETFHGIMFEIPKEFVDDGSGLTDTVSYGLPETAKDPWVVALWIMVNPDNNQTAQQAFDNLGGEAEGCEIVSANGIDMCWQPQSMTSPGSVIAALYFSCNGASYTIFIDYKTDSKPSYKEFANNFYKSIKPADSSSTSQSSSQSKSTASSSSKTSSKAVQSGKSTSGIPDNAIEWKNASSYMGKTVAVYGPIVRTNTASSSKGSPTYLDIGAAYPASNRVSIVIWQEDLHNFPQSPAKMYKGKTICVTGKLYSYDGATYIKVTSPSQITVL